MWERHEGVPIQSQALMSQTLKGLYPLGSDQLTKCMSDRTSVKRASNHIVKTEQRISSDFRLNVSTTDKKQAQTLLLSKYLIRKNVYCSMS
jgi:hypothetical protein